MKNVYLVNADITTFEGDAIVNAANKNLYYGGGVCGAIFEAAGVRELQRECSKFSPIHTGESVITKGCALKAKYVIHSVGPQYRSKDINGSKSLLIKTYESLFNIALDNNVKTIAIPSISTGIFGYPRKEAIPIALSVIDRYKDKFEGIYLYLIDDTYDMYLEELKKY